MEALDQDTAELEGHLQALKEGAEQWAKLAPADIVALLEPCVAGVDAVAEQWVERSADGKGLPAGSPLRAEEWVSGPWATLAGLNGLLHTLRALAAGSDPLAGMPVRTRADGQVVVQVFPAHFWDWLLLNGFHAEVWQQPSVTAENLRANVASRFSGTTEPQVALVLGAGNINAIPPLDALYKLVAEGQVCLVKLNPINHYLQELLNTAFAPLVERGFLRFVNGDGRVGAMLCSHPVIDTLHITGSVATHDLIVFGSGEEGRRRKQANEPANPREMSSELGGVGPTLVVPGDWTDADFRFQAEHLVTQKLHNRGFNCIASQLLVVPKGWDGTERLLAQVRAVLEEVVGDRPDYYRGVDERRTGFLEAHPDARTFGDGAFVFIEGLQPGSGDYCFQKEAFAPVWGVVEIAASEPAAFLEAAVAFANEELMGTLGCQVVIDPRTAKRHAAALDGALAALRYGTIGVNAWSGVGFLLPFASWGAFPGHPLNEVQSGRGVVHNALLFDKPEKTVVRGPFRPFPRTLLGGGLHWSPKPLWFVTHRHAEGAASRLTRFEATRNVGLIPPLFLAALRG